jgi:hypothetical protein
MKILEKIDYIIEKSFTKKDIPDYFYFVFNLEDSIDSLNQYKFKGLKGISSSDKIQFQFLNVARDCVLRMESKELLHINPFTKIMYDNPHYLVSKDLLALRRIYNSSGNNWEHQVFYNIYDMLRKVIKKNLIKNMICLPMTWNTMVW